MRGRLHDVNKKILVSLMIINMLILCSLVHKASAASSWSRARPSSKKIYDKKIGNVSTDGVASVVIGVHIGAYHENDPILKDFLTLNVSASANSRKGIQYDVWVPSDYNWYEVSEPTNITGDNVWVSLDLPFSVLFYGVEYNEVWVSDDGLLSFDPPPIDPPPQSIPSTSRPNSLIAPFWRDLNPAMGGSITYGRDGWYFVVSWNNVTNKGNDVPQTFQVVIKAEAGGSEFHNKIFFQYKSITKDYYTSVGVEDQVGNKGTSYDYNNLYNGLCLRFEYFTAGYRLERLTIRLTKSDDCAKINFLRTEIGGYNVILQNYEDPYGDFFATAIGFAAGLILPEAGIIWSNLVILERTAHLLSRDLSLPDFDAQDAGTGDNKANLTALSRDELRLAVKPFDSTLATAVLWSFTDSNDEDHFLTITSEAMYEDRSTGNYYTISTSVTLNMYIGTELTVETHSTGGSEIKDVKVWIDGNQFYSPVTVGVDSGSHAIDLEHVFCRGPYKYTFQHWEDGSTENPRIVNVKSAFYATAYYNMTYEGTCPTLFVWNGSEYIYETLLDIHGDSDVTLQHRIEQALVPQKGAYKLSLRELDEFTSHIDCVKLYVVDSDDEMHKTHLTKAIHSELGDVKELLLHDDDSRVDLRPSQTIDLKSTVPNIDEVAYFIVEINGHNKKDLNP